MCHNSREGDRANELLSEMDIRDIFGDVETIYHFHKTVLSPIISSSSPSELANKFSEVVFLSAQLLLLPL